MCRLFCTHFFGDFFVVSLLKAIQTELGQYVWFTNFWSWTPTKERIEYFRCAFFLHHARFKWTLLTRPKNSLHCDENHKEQVISCLRENHVQNERIFIFLGASDGWDSKRQTTMNVKTDFFLITGFEPY